MATINELTWTSLTAMVNEIKSPAAFLQNLLFSDRRPQNTETIEVSTVVKGRSIAPFVKKGSEAIQIEGHTATFANVEAPNIRIKRPFTPSELLFTRRPGSVIFPTPGQQVSALQAHIARDMQVMADLVTNSIEWMVSQALTGTISYLVEDEAAFTITYPKPAGHSITLLTPNGWNEANSNPHDDFLTAKRLLSDEHGLPLTHAIMSQQAADAFINNAQVASRLDNRNISIGQMELNNQYTAEGAIFLGMFAGVQCWEYSRSLDVNGTDTQLIRDNYVEFVAAVPAADNVLYYGAIADNRTLQGRNFIGERFSKSWEVEDPPARIALVHSRPLPVMRRPGSVVSIDVIV